MKLQNKLKIKSQYYEKLNYLFSKYNRILLVDITNVGSSQIQKCRKALSSNSVMVIGKNTLIRKVLRQHIKNKENIELFSSFISGNVGLIFSETEPFLIREILKANKVPASAKPGQISQCDVIIPSGQTDLPPEGTCFFQALNIQTKIQKGQIEIISPINLLAKGQLIGNSESVLLQKLNITPFSYELKIKQIFDFNTVYDTSVLDIKPESILEIINSKIYEFGLISTSINYPTYNYLKNSIKKTVSSLCGLAKMLDYKFQNKMVENVQPDVFSHKKTDETFNQIQCSKIENSSAENEEDQSGDMGLNLFD
nr:60S acidic ribosomal protein P0 [Cryptomonas curvata]|mmetsp:Transcript_20626/g.43342  ORF Transcript_20626/g.43342 Transcript_20626/m.43342 type:complete len:311 (-) Transcript_20626:183-1115(-)